MDAILTQIIGNSLSRFSFKIATAFAAAQSDMTGHSVETEISGIILLQIQEHFFEAVVFCAEDVPDICIKINSKIFPQLKDTA